MAGAKALIARRSRRKTSVKSDMNVSTTNKYQTKGSKTLNQRVKVLEKNMAQQERKPHENVLVYTGPASINNVPYITHLSDIDGADRDGQEVSAQFLDVFLRWVYLSGVDDNEACRMIVFRWKDIETGPTSADILDVSPGPTAATIKNVDAPYVHNGRDKFDVLFDKRFVLDENIGDQSMFRFKYTCPQGKSSRIKWTGALPTDVEVNHLYLMVMSETSAPVAGVTAEGYFRLYYKDN